MKYLIVVMTLTLLISCTKEYGTACTISPQQVDICVENQGAMDNYAQSDFQYQKICKDKISKDYRERYGCRAKFE